MNLYYVEHEIDLLFTLRQTLAIFDFTHNTMSFLTTPLGRAYK